MPILLLHGENTLEIGEAARAVRDRFNPADVLTFDGPSVSLSALSEAARTAGLFDPERLVIVHELHDRLKGTKKGGTEIDEFARILQDVAPTTTLMLVSPEMPGDSPLLAMVRAAKGTMRSYATPKKGELPRWIVARAKSHGAAIQHDAAELLAELIGGNPIMLESELLKLATYAGDEPITVATVDILVGQVTQESIFTLVDAIASGNRAKAFRLLHQHLEEASSTPVDVALYLIRMLARQMRILLRIQLGLQKQRSKGELIKELKLPGYFADRYFTQARRVSTSQLLASFELLASLEHGLKTGRAEAGAGLDVLVARLSA